MNRLISTLLAAALLALTAGCSTTKVYQNPGAAYGATSASQVAVFYSPPQQAYDVIGVVSADRWKPGFTDPSVADALPQLRAAAAQLGADAVIVRASRSNNDRHTVVEGEAIRYRDRSAVPAPTAAPSPASDCEACKKIGG
jgi:hypothetical protein